MERVLRPANPYASPQALVINVSDARGLDLVRTLAELGVGVVVHFTAHRRPVNQLIRDIWDGGGWVRAFDGSESGGGQGEGSLEAAWSTFGGGQLVFDASSRPTAPALRTARRRRHVGVQGEAEGRP